MKETGYHGTCAKYRYSIENNGLTPEKCKYRKDHWLGQGVYFFDDYDKAMWWANITSSQNQNCGAVIFQSDIEVPEEDVLNLDDNEQLDKFMTEILEMLKEIEKECPGEMPEFQGDDQFRAVFFDYYKIKNKISVIIATFQKEIAGYTRRRDAIDRKKQRMLMNKTGLRFHERQICVSKKG